MLRTNYTGNKYADALENDILIFDKKNMITQKKIFEGGEKIVHC